MKDTLGFSSLLKLSFYGTNKNLLHSTLDFHRLHYSYKFLLITIFVNSFIYSCNCILIILQWWTSTRVKFISTQCASLLCSSSAWVSSCCCYPRTGTSVSFSSAPSCVSVTIQQRATERQAPPQGSTGEGEPGPPCQHLHIDFMNYYHSNTHTHTHRRREGNTWSPLNVNVGTFALPGALPSLSHSSLGEWKDFRLPFDQ